ncbi:MAG: penicillin-binding protein 1C [Deltaproteobacteria bacterium]|nr:penicillin-binding protein 1C [Deltaproteobacteria bacterium]
MWARIRGRLRVIAFALALSVVLPPLGLAIAAALTPLPEELRSSTPTSSVRFVDRDGNLLREARLDDGARARWVPLAEVGELPVAALLAAEDRRFHEHHGVDPIAVVRAALSNARRLRVVSGASTLTMQLARTLRPRPKTLFGKLSEMALATRIDASLSKERILEEYLNRVSFGPNLRGIGAASHAYFGKAPKDLSLAEAALLAGVVRGPALYAPDRNPARAKARRAFVLRRMAEDGVIDEARRATADGEPIATIGPHPAFGAPHLVQGLLSGGVRALQPGLAWPSNPARVETTIDASLQRESEAAVRVIVERLRGRGVSAASVIVIDNATGDVLAWVGSPDVFDREHLGANDGVVALRQPGSTLKPFLYALAMETKGFTPATVLPDLELQVQTDAGVWIPRNYDGKFRGPVRLREALGNSLNVPAVWTAQQVGVAAFLERLRALGLDTLGKSASFYGPALALGDGEVKLVALANAYATLARGGLAKPLRVVRAVSSADGARTTFEPGAETRVLPARPVTEITDVLRDRRARLASFGDYSALDFPYDVAAKTGTSKSFRDNWTVGFSSAVTVGVWVGNFDGSPMQDVSGVTGAGPIFHAVMEAAMRTRTPGALVGDRPGEHRVALCALSGARASHACPHQIHEWVPLGVVSPGGATAEAELPSCEWHVPVRIDVRNGLRAGPACLAADTETRVYESLPPEYDAWAATEKRPNIPESSPFCPAADVPHASGPSASATLDIRKPLDGLKLVLDPDRPREAQSYDVEVVAPASVKKVTLRVDGERFATLGRPFVFEWPLALGKHTFVAQADGVPDSAAVSVTVRE